MNDADSLVQNRRKRLDFFADVNALDSLCNPAAIARLKSAVHPLDSRDLLNFLRGYRLAVATSLHELLEFTVDCATLLDAEFDDRLATWFHFPRQEQAMPILAAVSDSSSPLGPLCSKFDTLLAALRTSDSGIAETIAALEQCGAFASTFGRVAEECTLVSLHTGEGLTDRDSLLRVCMAERILDYVEYERCYLLAYDMVWGKQANFTPARDEFVTESETHLNPVMSMPLIGRVIPEPWWDGLFFGFDSIVRVNGVSLPDSEDSNINWFEELEAFVKSACPQNDWPSSHYGLSEFSQSSVNRLFEWLNEMDVPPIPPKDKLTAILGPDTVRLITSLDSKDYLDLEVVLTGAVAVYTNSPVQVLRVTHSDDRDRRDWVSVAVRFPRYGLASNASKWYLFYKMYHEGRMIDSDVAIARNRVNALLSRFEDNLEIENIDGLQGKDLLRFDDLPAYREMRKLSLKAVQVNAELRAVNAELLAAFWLQKQGYRNIEVSFKHSSLGKFEYDAVGVKDGRCLVVEVKGGEVRSDQLKHEFDRLSYKVTHLRARLADLKRALNCEDTIHAVSGLFISLADLSGFESTDSSIGLWDYDRFVSKLRAVGFTNRVVRLLERSYIIHSWPIDDFHEDLFPVGVDN